MSPHVPTVAFLEAFEDPTIAKARNGFFLALQRAGYDSRNGSLKIIYKNAEGNAGTMNLAVSYILSRKPDLIATSTTLSTLAVCQREQTIPVFMMVSPNPLLDGLAGPGIRPHPNLAGVYEDVDYIDTAIALIPQVIKHARKVAAIYSQGESQSASAYQRLRRTCSRLGLELEALPVNSSGETRLVVQKLMEGRPDAFFALPDNSVFASFETIRDVCRASGVPIFTSEEGLVDRGALAAFGADLYKWGYQAGLEAAHYLRHEGTYSLQPVRVVNRKRIFNESLAKQANLQFPKGFIRSDVSVPHTKNPLPGGDLRQINSLWLDALLTGLCMTFLAFGIYLSLRVFQIPDITTDGSFALGAVITGVCLANHLNVWLALPLAFTGGALAGSLTGFISTRFSINALLAGILVMTGLYSVNLFILGRANQTIDQTATVFYHFFFLLQNHSFMVLSVLLCMVLVTAGILITFLKTDFGIAMRATGSSPVMARSVGIPTRRMQVSGLALANGFTGIAGYLVAQFQGFVDIGMGTGIVLTGLGSVLIGDSFAGFLKVETTTLKLGLIVCGSIIFQLLIAAALSVGVDPLWIRLISSALVLGVVILPKLLKGSFE